LAVIPLFPLWPGCGWLSIPVGLPPPCRINRRNRPYRPRAFSPS
jgi:hypothetical protein